MPTIKTPRNSAKTCPKLTKTSKRYDKHRFGILLVKFGQVPHPFQWASIMELEQAFVFIVEVQLIF